MANINSFSQNMTKSIMNSVNTLSMQTAIQKSMTTNDTFVTYDYTDPNGEVSQVTIPSYDAVVNRVKAVEESINSLQTGVGSVSLADGSHRTVTLSTIAHTPSQITGLMDPTTFTVDPNWFFEELMFPGAKVNIDLTGQIEDSADRVRVVRVILDANNDAAQSLWMSDLSANNYDYPSLKVLLSNNGVPYYEDEETVELPLVSNTVSGVFQVVEDPIFINGNVWYQLDTLTYSTISPDGVNQGQNNILSVSDRLSYKESIFEVVEVNQNDNKIHIKKISGVDAPGMYAVFNYYQDPFRSKTLGIRFGANEYNIIYFKGVSEAHNLLADMWSDPIKFSSSDLVLEGTEGSANTSFAEYYTRYVVDWGAEMIAEAKESKVSAWYGSTPNSPVLNGNDFRVVQINTQINAAIDTTDVKNIAAEIESVKSQISSLKNTIAAQKTDLQSAVDTHTYNSIQQQIATNTTDLNNLQTTYTTLVDSFQTIVRENSAVTAVPKYHIRGFFAIPEFKYRDVAETVPEDIVGFDIAYRYIKEDNTGVSLATYSYTNPDGTEISATYSDWNIIQSPIKTKVYDADMGRYVWKSENVADGTEVNINQIDIPISKGEKVEFKVRSISEAGYPANPLRSAWSNAIIMDFPDSLATGNEIADLVQSINDDALTITITNMFDTYGITTHLSDTVANTESVTGTYYHHLASNIAYEDTRVVNDEGGVGRISMSLQEKIESIEVVNDDSSVLIAKNSADISVLSNLVNNKITEYDSSLSTLFTNLGQTDVSVRIHDITFDTILDVSGNIYNLKTSNKLHFKDSSGNLLSCIKVDQGAGGAAGDLYIEDTKNPKGQRNLYAYDFNFNYTADGRDSRSVKKSIETLDASVKVFDASINRNISNITDLSTRLKTYTPLDMHNELNKTVSDILRNLYDIKDGESKNLMCDEITVGYGNGGTRLSSNKVGGNLYVFDEQSNEQLGVVHTGNVIVYTGSTIGGKTNSLVDFIDQTNENTEDLATLRSEYDDTMKTFNVVIQTDGEQQYVTAYDIEARNELRTNTLGINRLVMRKDEPFAPINTAGNAVLNGLFCDVILYARDINAESAPIGTQSRSVFQFIKEYGDTVDELVATVEKMNNGIKNKDDNPDAVVIDATEAVLNSVASLNYYFKRQDQSLDTIEYDTLPRLFGGSSGQRQGIYAGLGMNNDMCSIYAKDFVILSSQEAASTISLSNEINKLIGLNEKLSVTDDGTLKVNAIQLANDANVDYNSGIVRIHKPLKVIGNLTVDGDKTTIKDLDCGKINSNSGITANGDIACSNIKVNVDVTAKNATFTDGLTVAGVKIVDRLNDIDNRLKNLGAADTSLGNATQTLGAKHDTEFNQLTASIAQLQSAVSELTGQKYGETQDTINDLTSAIDAIKNAVSEIASIKSALKALEDKVDSLHSSE